MATELNYLAMVTDCTISEFKPKKSCVYIVSCFFGFFDRFGWQATMTEPFLLLLLLLLLRALDEQYDTDIYKCTD